MVAFVYSFKVFNLVSVIIVLVNKRKIRKAKNKETADFRRCLEY